MTDEEAALRPALRTPRAAAIAGIVFSLLLMLALVLVRLAIPGDPRQAGTWLSDPGKRASVAVALNLVPFAGIAFLWFMGVLRDRIGHHEDRFFATVFLGSGLLFVAMLFVASAMAGGLLVEAAARSAAAQKADVLRLGGRVTGILLNIYAMRMAAVFTISTVTIALRTRIIPRWLGYLGYAFALVLLVSLGISPWVQ
ncbi:MAG: hypothetical protein M3O87_05825, partial [Candidatus Dormibacteraeota bacterium]|nr:hypothetical protein [Candidatus Dormibacteraeota bacterium]